MFSLDDTLSKLHTFDKVLSTCRDYKQRENYMALKNWMTYLKELHSELLKDIEFHMHFIAVGERIKNDHIVEYHSDKITLIENTIDKAYQFLK